MDFPIDFVVDWVDGSDAEWLENRNLYAKEKVDIDDVRYRDWGLLKYWFRAIEKNAPWVNKIYFVTCGQKPDWLNENNSKIILVDHTDYIDKKFLPTFNSNAIELPIYKIKGLSEHFVFFNDDFYLNSPVIEEDFFDKKGIPLDSGVLSPQIPIKNSVTHITTNNVQIVNKYFSRSDIIRHLGNFINLKYGKQNIKTLATLPWSQILGFHDFHTPISFQKKVFSTVWEKESNALTETVKHKFRTNDDLNIWLFRYFQLMEGKFKPRKASFAKYYNIGNTNKLVIKDILNSTHKAIVLNDQPIECFDNVRDDLKKAFEEKYKQKSEFER